MSWFAFVLAALLLVGPSRPGTEQAAAPAAAVSVPADVAKMVNPVKATPQSQAQARKMYGYDCAMCHGGNGNGKGELAADMKLTLKDYTNAADLKDVSDGEIFNVIKNGKGQMTGEGDRVKTDEVWNMVILVRSFAKK
jgi:mono/diheme cytochrome c family protein